MSTRDYAVDAWPCPCGAGELQFHTSTPDHPWNPQTSTDEVTWTCNQCNGEFEYELEPQFTGSKLEGAPKWSDTKTRLLYSLRAEHEPRQLARVRVDEARRAVSALHRQLRHSTLAELTKVTAHKRHVLAAQIFGFPDIKQAKSFIAKRHVPTFVDEAMVSVDRRKHAAHHFHRHDEMIALEAALDQAIALVSGLGPVPMHSYHERDNISAMVSRAFP